MVKLASRVRGPWPTLKTSLQAMKVGSLAMSQKTNGSSNLEFILGLFLSWSRLKLRLAWAAHFEIAFPSSSGFNDQQAWSEDQSPDNKSTVLTPNPQKKAQQDRSSSKPYAFIKLSVDNSNLPEVKIIKPAMQSVSREYTHRCIPHCTIRSEALMELILALSWNPVFWFNKV